MGCRKSSSKKEVHNDIVLPQEIRKISNNLSLKRMRKTNKQTNPKVSRKKEIVKIRAKINEKKDLKKNSKKRSVKLRAGFLKR